MRINKYFIEKLIVYSTIFIYVVLGNAFTFNIGNRFPVKLGEIYSIIVFLVFIVVLLIRRISIRRIDFDLSKYKPVLLWMLVGTVSAILNTCFSGYSLSQLAYGLLYMARLLHIFALAFVVYFLAKINKIKKEHLIRFIVLCYLMVCAIGFIQLLLYPIAIDWYTVFYKMGCYWATPDPHQNRLISTYFDPNYLASMLVIPFSICLSEIFFNEKKNKHLLFNLLSIAILLVTILLTKSRSGIVGIAMSVIVLFLCYGVKRKIPYYFLILIALSIPVLIYMVFFSNIEVFERILTFSEDKSAQHRFDSWSMSFEIFFKSPGFGIGYNMYGAYQTNIGAIEEATNSASAYGVDSSLLFVLITTGLMGGIIVLYILKNIFMKKSTSSLDYAYKAIIFSSLIVSFFNNLLFNILWLFPVLFISLIVKENKKRYEEDTLFIRA